MRVVGCLNLRTCVVSCAQNCVSCEICGPRAGNN